MNARQLVQLLKEPQGITPDMLSELTQLVRQYPYFSAAHLVYLKALKESGDARFSSYLPYAATHAPSVEWLYLYLNSAAEPLQVEAAPTVQPPVEVVAERPSAIIAGWDAPAAPPAAHVEVVPTSVEEVKEVVQEPAVAEAEREEVAPAESSPAEIIPAEIAATESIAAPEEEVEEELEFIEDELVSASISEDPILEILDQKLYTLEETENTIEQQYSLIDQFLSENPRIVPRADIPHVINDISEQSLVDDGEIVTEMLAKIYASQGLISKAIAVYEKLILKFPEKRAYFAAGLEKLKESK